MLVMRMLSLRGTGETPSPRGRRAALENGAAVHVEHADPCGQCSGWRMGICVARAKLSACSSVSPGRMLMREVSLGEC